MIRARDADDGEDEQDGARIRQRRRQEARHTDSSRMMSESIRGSLRRAETTGDGMLSLDEEEAFRAAYMQMVESGTARAQLVAVAQDLRNPVAAAEPSGRAVPNGGDAAVANSDAETAADVGGQAVEQAEAESWEVQLDGRLFSFSTDQVVTIGLPGYANDIETDAGSRMHCIILPVVDELYLCDVGGKFGFSVTERSTSERGMPARAIDCSRPHARRVLRVGIRETAVVQLVPSRRRGPGSTAVVLNPKVCTICLDKPREVRFECGHYVCCRSCSQQLRQERCPICRAQLRRPAQTAAHAHSTQPRD